MCPSASSSSSARMATSPSANSTRALPPGLRPPPFGGLRRRRQLAHAAVRRPVPRQDDAKPSSSFPKTRKLRRATSGAPSRRPLLYSRRRRRLRRSTRTSRTSWPKIESRRHTGGNVLFYLSTQPSQYATIALGRRRRGTRQGQRLAPPRRRKALRPRPRKRARTERPPARSLRRNRCLPHRSLPG